MLDIKFVRENPEIVKQNIKNFISFGNNGKRNNNIYFNEKENAYEMFCSKTL